jgi:hypothetical protein
LCSVNLPRSLIGSAPLWLFLGLLCADGVAFAVESSDPEEVIRALVRANAEKDLSTLSRLMAHDEDSISYTIGGRKYVGWSTFAKDIQDEFDSVTRLEIPITELTVWARGDTAWFAMELDYIRYLGQGLDQQRTVLPLRETGVLERRNGDWVLVSWHESSRSTGLDLPVPDPIHASAAIIHAAGGPMTTVSATVNLGGEWEIQEEDRSYKAILDAAGNGTYTWQGGKITTTGYADRRWQGTWLQNGNDREGGFEVLLSEDGTQAKGVWWYTRVGDKKNIPPRQWGGPYTWKRLAPLPSPASTP